jgi:hypothetical protein
MKLLKPDSEDELLKMFLPIMTMPPGTPLLEGGARVLTRISSLISVAMLTIIEETGLEGDMAIDNAEKTFALMREQVMNKIRAEIKTMTHKGTLQ